VEAGGKVYVFGGYLSGGLTNSVACYDPVMNTWSDKNPMPLSTGYVSAATISGKIYVTGANGVSSEVYLYDPAVDAWSILSPMISKRSKHADVAVSGKLYAVGGYAYNYGLATVESYDPALDY